MQDGAAIADSETDSPKRPRGALALDIVARWRGAGRSGIVFLSTSEQQAEYLGANIHSLFPDCPVWYCRAGIRYPTTQPGRRATSWAGAPRSCGG